VQKSEPTCYQFLYDHSRGYNGSLHLENIDLENITKEQIKELLKEGTKCQAAI